MHEGHIALQGLKTLFDGEHQRINRQIGDRHRFAVNDLDRLSTRRLGLARPFRPRARLLDLAHLVSRQPDRLSPRARPAPTHPRNDAMAHT
jgi:hypothetical protein